VVGWLELKLKIYLILFNLFTIYYLFFNFNYIRNRLSYYSYGGTEVCSLFLCHCFIFLWIYNSTIYEWITLL
jgi:hypothetical protein